MLNPGNDQPSHCHLLPVCSVSAKEFYWIKRYPQNNDYPGLEDAAEEKETYIYSLWKNRLCFSADNLI